ncbi:MAG: hypothetical protein KOO61_06970 [Spirochaetales bacterium]|nr:hypothetical protein [Spirochaetales bacterium]
MQLVHKKVPREFLEMLPDGVKFIHRHGKEFLVVEELSCPNGHSLMAESVRIHDEPSIRIAVERPNGTGRIFIDAFWGSHAKLYDFLPAPSEDMIHIEARCATCGVSLSVERPCGRMECDSQKNFLFHLPGENNFVYVCAKLGCPEHSIVVGGVPQHLNKLISEINYFGYGEDEQFKGI